jgi:hypothetical protein
MSLENHLLLYRDLVIAGPTLGGACALLAKAWGRKQCVCSIPGFFFSGAAALTFLHIICRMPGKRE